MNQRKMAFYELDKGRLALEMQREFEEISRICLEKGKKTEAVLTITCLPPEGKDLQFAKVTYKITKKVPAKESVKFFVEINKDGVVVADGNSPLETIQEELEFPAQAKVINLNKQGDN